MHACAGIVYGLYLTFSTWLLYFIATKTQFFSGSIKMFNLNDQARCDSCLSRSVSITKADDSPHVHLCQHCKLFLIQSCKRTDL